MLGGEYMNICNPNFIDTKMDNLIRELGGCVYTKCYTPSPDTPRSSACMWTGLYPHSNGCDIRLKWPRYFLSDEVDSIWKAFKRNNYNINVYINKSTEHVGLLPNIEDINVFYSNIYNFINNAKVSDNSFNFVYLNDLHRILDNSKYSIAGYIRGNEFCANVVKHFLDHYGADYFDLVMIYSDHGFRLSGATKKHLLDNDRTKTFMYVRKKGDKMLEVDNRLRSNLDVFPTMCSFCGIDIDNKVHGLSLDNKDGHRYVFMEDHDKFTSELGLTIEHWACLDKESGWHWLEMSGEWEHEDVSCAFDSVGMENKISCIMSFFADNKKLYHVLNSLYKLKIANLEQNYSDGTPVEYYKTPYRLHDIKCFENKNVIVYGAGQCGTDVCMQLNEEKNINVVGWVDLNWQEKAAVEIGHNIEGPAALFDRNYDYVIIALFNKAVAHHAMEILKQFGVASKKIVWEQPYFEMIQDV